MTKIEKDTGVSRAAVKEAIKTEMEKGTIESKTIKIRGQDRTIYIASQNQGMENTIQQQQQTMQQQATGMARTPSLGRGR
jgi:DNA-binding FadR family transcriptional regulator